MLRLREIPCKTILNKSGLADFTLNCYVGCSHRCLYCYARYMKKFKDRPEDWGYFVDVKVNAPWALTRDIRRLKKPGHVFMSSICDAWQPIEAKYRLSRACLKLLLETGFEVDILTKSSLILADFDLLEAYKTPRLSMTLTTLDKPLKMALEPYASDPKERILTLRKASEKGIKTEIFIGPLIPEFTDTPDNIDTLFRALKGLNLERIYVDRLNLRWGVLETLKKGLAGRREHRQNLGLFIYKTTDPAKYQEYSRQLRQKVAGAARQYNLLNKVTFCF